MRKIGQLLGLNLYIDSGDEITAKRAESIITHAFDMAYPIKYIDEIENDKTI